MSICLLYETFFYPKGEFMLKEKNENDVPAKILGLLNKITNDLARLGSKARLSLDNEVTKDTGEMFKTVIIELERDVKFMMYASSNNVGIKTFLQGMAAVTSLILGTYSMRPMTERSRRFTRSSILTVGGPDVPIKKRVDAGLHPRFMSFRNRFGA